MLYAKQDFLRPIPEFGKPQACPSERRNFEMLIKNTYNGEKIGFARYASDDPTLSSFQDVAPCRCSRGSFAHVPRRNKALRSSEKAPINNAQRPTTRKTVTPMRTPETTEDQPKADVSRLHQDLVEAVSKKIGIREIMEGMERRVVLQVASHFQELLAESEQQKRQLVERYEEAIEGLLVKLGQSEVEKAGYTDRIAKLEEKLAEG